MALSAGAKIPIHIAEDATIKKVVVLTVGGPGDVVIDIWKDAFASYPPSVSESICGGNLPTITNGESFEDSTLTDWTTVVSQGDTLMVVLDSVSGFDDIVVALELEPVGSIDTDGYTDARVREIIAEEGAQGTIVNEGDSFTITLGGGVYEDIDVFAMCGSPAGVVEVTFTNPAGTVVRSSSTARAALNFAGFASGSLNQLIALRKR